MWLIGEAARFHPPPEDSSLSPPRRYCAETDAVEAAMTTVEAPDGELKGCADFFIQACMSVQCEPILNLPLFECPEEDPEPRWYSQ